MSNLIKSVSSVFTWKLLVRVSTSVLIIAVFSFVCLLQYYTAKSTYKKQSASVVPTLKEMEDQTVDYVEGSEIAQTLIIEEKNNNSIQVINNQKVDQSEQSISSEGSVNESSPAVEVNPGLSLEPKAYKKGDWVALSAVSFHPGSNILGLESEPELKKLLELMNGNPKLKIKIQGHANENLFGTIKKAKEENIQTLFDTEQGKSFYGNSKKLALYRVKVIEAYLVKNGISGKRISTKSWVGNKKKQKNKDIKLEDKFSVEVVIMS